MVLLQYYSVNDVGVAFLVAGSPRAVHLSLLAFCIICLFVLAHHLACFIVLPLQVVAG